VAVKTVLINITKRMNFLPDTVTIWHTNIKTQAGTRDEKTGDISIISLPIIFIV
jgi:hypothetical protein